jgi:chromosome segregation ATPase
MTGTSDAPGQVMGASFREDSGGIMSSIAAVRELLEKNGSSSPESSLKYEISAIKQSRYEDRLRFEEQIQKQNDSIRDFQIKLQQVEQEAQSEKSLRQTLEKTNEALDEHKKELTAQLELVSKSRGSLEGTVVGFRSSLEEEKVAFLKEKERLEALVNELSLQKKNELENTGEWEARFLTSQRQTEELNADVVALIDQMESARVRHQETIQDYTKSIETVKQRLEETDAARKVAEEKLKSSMPQENKDNSSDLRPRLDASERQVKILKAQKLILQTQMGGKLVEHQGIIQEHVKSNKDMGRRLQEEEIARKKAEEKVSFRFVC